MKTAELKVLPVSVLKPAAYNPRKKRKTVFIILAVITVVLIITHMDKIGAWLAGAFVVSGIMVN